MVTVDLNIPVICYGLRADFSLKGFPGSTRLLELAHTIEEMKTICTCGRKAICNCRKVNGQFVFEGEQVAIDLENDVQYVSMCPQCYSKRGGRSTLQRKTEILLYFIQAAVPRRVQRLFCVICGRVTPSVSLRSPESPTGCIQTDISICCIL